MKKSSFSHGILLGYIRKQVGDIHSLIEHQLSNTLNETCHDIYIYFFKKFKSFFYDLQFKITSIALEEASKQ